MTVAKTIEVSADSNKAAIREGVAKAGESVENISRVWVKDQIALVENRKVDTYRVHMNVTFCVQ
jgi:flavin-binding protein dodecin